jgi:hypothetical protein
MELWTTNPYSIGEAIVLANNKGSLLVREPLDYVPDEKDQFVKVTLTKDIDQLSFDAYNGYGNDPSKLYWLIADVNKIVNPLDLDSLLDQELIIPDYINVQRFLE